jgi:hypothetical protein
MTKKAVVYAGLIVLGLAMALVSIFVFRDAEPKAVFGLMLGAGAGMFGMSVSGLVGLRYAKTHPDMVQQSRIEHKDERNTMIRDKAKARSGDIVQWLIVAMAWVMILIDAPLWVTLTQLLVFMAYRILWITYVRKFQKEM